MRIVLPLLLAFIGTPGLADPIPPGRYEVSVHLDLPHIDTKDYDFTTEICLADPGGRTVLGPLSPGPFAECPRASKADDSVLTIEVRCPGGNAGVAIGTYLPTRSGFRGRVEMNLGGKNMTLAEEQRGRYLGECG